VGAKNIEIKKKEKGIKENSLDCFREFFRFINMTDQVFPFFIETSILLAIFVFP
jgi:hypothetical protein